MTLSILKERGVDVELVVPEITDIPLSERSLRANAIAKAFGASNVVYVSVHVNAAGNSHQWMKARGWSVFVYNKPSSKAVMLASSLFDKAAEKGVRMRKPEALKKYWNANFAVLRQTVCPAVLVEHFFMDNRDDCAYLLTEKSVRECAEVLADGIVQYINNL